MESFDCALYLSPYELDTAIREGSIKIDEDVTSEQYVPLYMRECRLSHKICELKQKIESSRDLGQQPSHLTKEDKKLKSLT